MLVAARLAKGVGFPSVHFCCSVLMGMIPPGSGVLSRQQIKSSRFSSANLPPGLKSFWDLSMMSPSQQMLRKSVSSSPFVPFAQWATSASVGAVGNPAYKFWEHHRGIVSVGILVVTDAVMMNE